MGADARRLESAAEFVASVALVALGAGATGAAFGRAIGYLFGAALGVVLLSRYLHRSVLWKTGTSPVGRREFSSYAFAMLIVGGAFMLFSQIDVLLIGAMLGPGAAGIYSAPLRLIILFGYPGLALSQGIAPRMARNPNEPPRTEALRKGLRYLLILQAATATVTLVWAEPLCQVAPRRRLRSVRRCASCAQSLHLHERAERGALRAPELFRRGSAADPGGDRRRPPQCCHRRRVDPGDRDPFRRDRNERLVRSLSGRPRLALPLAAQPPARRG